MSRYIDVTKLKSMIEAKADTLIEGKQAFDYVARWLDVLPTADVGEVRRGKWIVTRSPLAGDYRIDCSCCGLRELRGPAWNITWGLPNYCQNCGAKMEVERSENGT